MLHLALRRDDKFKTFYLPMHLANGSATGREIVMRRMPQVQDGLRNFRTCLFWPLTVRHLSGRAEE